MGRGSSLFRDIDKVLAGDYTRAATSKGFKGDKVHMNGKLIKVVFWGLVAAFIVVISLFSIPAARKLLMGGIFHVTSGAVLLSLGGALIYTALREQATGMFKKFLILTGASAVGIPLSAVLHNVVYGVFIYFFGAGFWERIGLSDEPFFFVLAIIVCPLGFLVGTVGSIVHFVRSTK